MGNPCRQRDQGCPLGLCTSSDARQLVPFRLGWSCLEVVPFAGLCFPCCSLYSSSCHSAHDRDHGRLSLLGPVPYDPGPANDADSDPGPDPVINRWGHANTRSIVRLSPLNVRAQGLRPVCRI